MSRCLTSSSFILKINLLSILIFPFKKIKLFSVLFFLIDLNLLGRTSNSSHADEVEKEFRVSRVSLSEHK